MDGVASIRVDGLDRETASEHPEEIVAMLTDAISISPREASGSRGCLGTDRTPTIEG
jgi:hypothetical protein